MRRFFAWFASPRRSLIVGGLVAALLALASPFLWAGYHEFAGLSAFKLYHSTEAREHFEACMRIWPWSRSSRLHLLAARAARRDSDFEAARQHLQECQDLRGDGPPDEESVLEWAMLRGMEGDLDTVEESLKTSLRKHPEMAPLILEALAGSYLRMSRVVHALRYVDAWLEIQPDNPQAWFIRGNIHRQVGAHQSAAEDFRHVLEADPERHQARRWLALALLEFGRYQEALEHMEVLYKLHPQDVDTRVRLAICHSRLGHDAEARALLDEVLAEQPENGLALLTRGQLDMKTEKFDQAESWLGRAARVMPYDYKAQWALGECLRRAGKTEEADAQMARADQLKDRRQRQGEIMTHLMSQRPNDPALQSELGTLYLQLGSPEVGEGWLLHALRLDPNQIPALEALAEFYQQRGEQEKAEEYRQRIRDLSPPKKQDTPPKS
jgi:tetratricopeptide (TPR) repeat protein